MKNLIEQREALKQVGENSNNEYSLVVQKGIAEAVTVVDNHLAALLQVGDFTFTPEILTYSSHAITIGFMYKNEDGRTDRFVEVRYKAIDKNGKETEYNWKGDLVPVTYRVENVSFYSTSGWNDLEQARCILIGRIANAVDTKIELGRSLAEELFTAVQKDASRRSQLSKIGSRADYEIREINKVLSQQKLTARMKVGKMYTLKNRVMFVYGESRWDVVRLDKGFKYKIAKETEKMATIEFYNAEGALITDFKKRKETLTSFIRSVISAEEEK